jgi:hypothetical protein
LLFSSAHVRSSDFFKYAEVTCLTLPGSVFPGTSQLC